jgi:hypothetical protein
MEKETRVKKSKVIIKNTEELFYGEGSDLRRLYSYPAIVQVRVFTRHSQCSFVPAPMLLHHACTNVASPRLYQDCFVLHHACTNVVSLVTFNQNLGIAYNSYNAVSPAAIAFGHI